MDSQAKWLEMAGQWQQTLMQQWTQMASAGAPAGSAAQPHAQAFANNPFAALAQMGMAGFAGAQQPVDHCALHASCHDDDREDAEPV